MPRSGNIGIVLFGPLLRVMRTFIITFGNEKLLLLLCMAMGFAYVLHETQCDVHLVQLLIKPFRRVRGLFLMGVVWTGFLVNIPLVSQAATAAVAGAVLLPLGKALGLRTAVVAAALLLGSSIGGELLNPSSPETRTVVEGVRDFQPAVSGVDFVMGVRHYIPWHLLVATTVFLLLNGSRKLESSPETLPDFRVNIIKASVPFAPLLLLLALAPPLQLWRVPQQWLLVDASNVTEAKSFDARLIGACMLVGVVLAIFTAPRSAGRVVGAFFNGIGYSVSSIISIIVAANCFGEALRSIGVATLVGNLLQGRAQLLFPLAICLPLLFGTLTGSGVAATQSLFQIFIGPSHGLGVDPLVTGGIVSIGGAAGRTMSPVSPANVIISNLTGVRPLELSRLVAIPLLAGLCVVAILTALR
jgi:C4-dicarboxylate transporter, DcuC family